MKIHAVLNLDDFLGFSIDLHYAGLELARMAEILTEGHLKLHGIRHTLGIL